MGKYSVPEEIRKLRPAGTQVKRQGDRFYVYETSSTKKKVTNEDGTIVWKTFTKSGKCIGSITSQDGFISNQGMLSQDEVTVLDYGDYAFALKSSSTLQHLKAVFNPNDANQIYALALIMFINGFTYMCDVYRLFSESYLSLYFPHVHTGETALQTLYENLGRKREKVDAFNQRLIDHSSHRLAFDGHVIACTSEKNDLSEFGYKASKLNSAQMNWMTAYDVDTKKPVASEMFCGSDPDKTAIQRFFERYYIQDTLFIVDRGFNTKDNKELMSQNGNAYIVPMVQGRNDYNDVYSKIDFDKTDNFIYDKDGYSSLIYYQDFREINGKRYIAYVDTTRQAAERKTYKENMDAGKKGFTPEGLIENEKNFGLFILETSATVKSQYEIFCDYKSRWGLETFFDYVDNTLDFNGLYQQDSCRTQGLSFIMQISGMIYHELKEITDSKNLSLKATLKTLHGLKLSKQKNDWKVQNVVKAKRTLADVLGVNLQPSIVSPA